MVQQLYYDALRRSLQALMGRGQAGISEFRLAITDKKMCVAASIAKVDRSGCVLAVRYGSRVQGDPDHAEESRYGSSARGGPPLVPLAD